ncbi:MAG: hypothetical protein WCQ21_10220 [Verrucomicrobiota bacterium]
MADPTVGPTQRLKGDSVFPNDRLTGQVARAHGFCLPLYNQTVPTQTNPST